MGARQDTRTDRLAQRFRLQEAFAGGYSPLYARLFGLIADWLSAPAALDDPLVSWLLQAAGDRPTLDVTLLLAAGLHRDVLSGRPEVARLAHFYPTAGGREAADGPAFAAALRQVILDRRPALAAFMRDAQVQTNETGRGLCWLLPLLATRWPAVHLVDLGASAGLNLVAEQRSYRLVDHGSDAVLLDLGLAGPVQFAIPCRGRLEPLSRLSPALLPAIASRTGCDLAPFGLETAAAEQTLMAFVWADQLGRLQRLREGIAAFHRVQVSESPVRLFAARLPDELEGFLRQRVPAEPALPVVIYNTYTTTYLPDKGASLGGIIGAWAAGRQRPVLWLQWELSRGGRRPPYEGWCAWTADLWHGDFHRRWLLAWVHPHGAAAEFTAGLAAFCRYAFPDAAGR